MNSLLAVLVGLVLSAPVVAEPLVERRVHLFSGEPVVACPLPIWD